MGGLHAKGRRSILRDEPSGASEKTSYNANDYESIERSFVVVWCDAEIGINPKCDDDTNTLIQLGRIVNTKRQLIHTFNELNACQEFLSHVNNVCLIVSGSIGQQLVPVVHDLYQIHSVYVFCMNKAKHELWANQFEKVRGVFTDIKEICECLKAFFISRSSSEYDRLQFDIFSKYITLPSPENHELSFTYSILSKIILLNMTLTKQEMIYYCRMKYITDYQIQLLNEFENNYLQHDHMWWFTRDGFFQGIINQALRTHDLYSLCTMSPFIKDLEKKLNKLHSRQMTSTKSIILYFSRSILQEEFSHIRSNLGGLMCINQFLFANTEQAIALMFIEHQNSISVDTTHINILFEITVPKNIEPNVCYANIGAVSLFVHEQEYLFSMSSIFRIDKVEKFPEIPSASLIHLTLVDKNDPQLTNLTKFIDQNQLCEENDLSLLGETIIDKLYQFKSTRNIFEQVLNSKTKQIRSVLLHYNMGIIYSCLHDYSKSIDEYKYAINLARNFLPNGQQKDNLCLVPLYSNLGLTFQEKNNFTHAFDHAFRSLDILLNDHENSIYKKEISASCYFNLGIILDQQKKVSEAKTYYEQALKIRRQYLPIDHPDVMVLQKLTSTASSQISDITD